MLVDKVREQLQEATKKGDSVRVSTLRLLMAALEYKRGQKMAEFSEADELAVIKSEAKKRQEAIEIYGKMGQSERVVQESAELAILSAFLPEMASEEEIRRVVQELRDKAPGKGQLIGMVIGKIGKDRVEGTVVARIVNEL